MGGPRSARREVRNPVFSLPSAGELLALPPEQRAVLARLFGELAADARTRAQRSWRQNKGPMAVYWKAVGAYSTHIRRAIRSGAGHSKTEDNHNV